MKLQEVGFIMNVSIALLVDASLQREVLVLPRATMRFVVGVHASLHYLACARGSKLRRATWVMRQARSLHLLSQRPAESMEIY